jgi:hypothetical protein
MSLDDTAVDTTNEEQEQPEQLTQEERDAHAEFTAGFRGEDSDPPARSDEGAAADVPTEHETELQETQDETVETEETEPAASAADEDPKYAALTAQIQALQAQLQGFAQFEHRLKSAEGRIGAISAGKHAATAAKQAGNEAPSHQQIEQAAGSSKKWEALKEEWPEWASAIEERFGSAQAQPSLDPDQLATEAANRAAQQLAARENQREQARAYAEIEQKHQGWQTVVKGPEFHRSITAGNRRSQQSLQRRRCRYRAKPYRKTDRRVSRMGKERRTAPLLGSRL